MSYVELNGNIFNSECEAVVNTINCVGAMGKGIALEFRRRYPAMYTKYRKLCSQNKISPGQIWPYKDEDYYILNFAIKDHWRNPSKIEWIETSLEKFVTNYERLEISSVAFPWMGAMNGGIPLEEIQKITRYYLSNLKNIHVEVYNFDPSAPDPFYWTLISQITGNNPETFSHKSGISINSVEKIYSSVDKSPRSLNELILQARLGKEVTDKLYSFIERNKRIRVPQDISSGRLLK